MPEQPIVQKQAEPDKPIVIVLNSAKPEKEVLTVTGTPSEVLPTKKIQEPVSVIAVKSPDLFIESFKTERITTLPIKTIDEITSEVQELNPSEVITSKIESPHVLDLLSEPKQVESIKIESVSEVKIAPANSTYIPEMTAAFQPLPENYTDDIPPAIVKHSIFSVVEEDEEEESSEHWANKYIQVKPQQPQATIASQVSSQPVAYDAVNSPPVEQIQLKVKTPTEPQQPTLNLAQDNVARFKGTDKTVVEGEDLDVPTWMRLRQKLKSK